MERWSRRWRCVGAEKRGTKVIFKPDAEIFYNAQRLAAKQYKKDLIEHAFLNKGLKITLTDERTR